MATTQHDTIHSTTGPTTTRNRITRSRRRKGTQNADKLVRSLQHAYSVKGEHTPTGDDADHSRYSLYPKRNYITVFGSWNNAIRAAGLPVNEWSKQGGDTTRDPIRPAQVDDIEAVLMHQIERERQEIEVMERILHRLHANVA